MEKSDSHLEEFYQHEGLEASLLGKCATRRPMDIAKYMSEMLASTNAGQFMLCSEMSHNTF